MLLAEPKQFASEAAMQAELFQYFWNYHPVTRKRIFHVPNGGSRNKIEAVQLRAQGLIAGVPDLIVLWEGKMYGIELKVEGGKLSDAQKKLHEVWLNTGIKVFVCWSFEEAKQIIKNIFSI